MRGLLGNNHFLICSCVFSHFEVSMGCLLQRREGRDVMGRLHGSEFPDRSGWGPSALPAAVVKLLLKNHLTSLASGPWRAQT